MSVPKVSIVIGAYNCEKTIQETVRSVMGQTFGDWELIVVDDGSTDKTLDQLAAVDDARVRIVRLERNSGLPAVARNRGIGVARGEFIAFLDHDDIWRATKLEIQLPHLDSASLVGVASDASLIVETPYHRRARFGRSSCGYVDYGYRDILNANPIITSSLVVRRREIEAVGAFGEEEYLFCAEDWELWLRMARQGSFRVLEEPLLSYRVARKRGLAASRISKNCLKILDQQVRRGYATDDEIVEPRAGVNLAIARNLLEFDPGQCRKYYAEAIKESSDLNRKMRGCVGLFLSFLPDPLRRAALRCLYAIAQA